MALEGYVDIGGQLVSPEGQRSITEFRKFIDRGEYKEAPNLADNNPEITDVIRGEIKRARAIYRQYSAGT